MFPAETSLIPVTVALARFVETNGIASMFGHYPHWYLGVPYQYLTGPIIPLLQVSLHKVIPGLSLFEVTYLLLFLSFLASIVGWGILAKKISGKRFIGLVVGILLFILPWRYLSTLVLSEASGVIAKNLLPFVLLVFWQYYKKRDRKSAAIAILTLSFLLLINTSVLAIFAVGISALILAFSFRKGRVRKVTKFIKPTLVLVLISLVLTTLWYTPGYWWTVINNPSIGGASGIKVFLRIFDLLKASIPLVLAVITVYFSGKIKSRLSIFSLTWVFTFLFLTAFRFIGDPDFWQDWSSWFSELEIGLAFLAVKVIYDLRFKIYDKKIPATYYLLLATLIVPFYLTWRIHLALGQPQLVSNVMPNGVRSLEALGNVAGKERVFISGSTVFWANSLYELSQVRGGVDKAAIHPNWDHAAYQLREGSSSELARAWLEALGVSYVLVHSPNSAEAYHDFRNIDKWKEVGEVVWMGNGDVIVAVPASLAWVVDLEKLEKVKSPESGIDFEALNQYLSAKKRAISYRENDNQIIIEGELNQNEGIVLAMSHNVVWKFPGGQLKKDPLGNMLLIPDNYSRETFTLRYR